MLLYSNRGLCRIVLTSTASVVWRRDSLIPGCIIAFISVAIQYLIENEYEWAPKISHHYGIHALGGIVCFAVVFRTNLGWQRYWEAITQLHVMYSKWVDAYSQVCAFARVTIEAAKAKGTEEAREKARRVVRQLETIESHFILLSALAADKLANGDTCVMDHRIERVGFSKQITLRKLLWQEDTGSKKLPRLILKTGYEGPINPRDSLVEPNSPSEAKLNRPSSFDQAELSKRTDDQAQDAYVVKRLPEPEERQNLEESMDKVTVVMYWILQGLTMVSKDLDIAPPIQSRMYQELSNGMLGFSQALKITDCPFPFPYAQLLSVLLIAFSLCIPVYIPIFTQSYSAGFFMALFVFQGIWGVNEVAKDLENPFGSDENDIPLADFHARFLEVVKAVNLSHDVRVQVSTKRDLRKLQEKDRSRKETGREMPAAPAPAAAAPPPATSAAAASTTPAAAAPPPAVTAFKEPPISTPVAILAPLTPGAAARVQPIDATVSSLERSLANIAVRMEKHLERIARELETGNEMGERAPLEQRGGADKRPLAQTRQSCPGLGLSCLNDFHADGSAAERIMGQPSHGTGDAWAPEEGGFAGSDFVTQRGVLTDGCGEGAGTGPRGDHVEL
eukprot:TRINITY_DN4026_c0_g2_i2.p1 TRINITY_DN4026_c0_g2~~TRINITY_DN4026_c0_g2_i2.p1  ORF type:complete len:619 (-),score=114.78 TRINITY_DN4026_c0_g2_i2:167-2023(-)